MPCTRARRMTYSLRLAGWRSRDHLIAHLLLKSSRLWRLNRTSRLTMTQNPSKLRCARPRRADGHFRSKHPCSQRRRRLALASPVLLIRQCAQTCHKSGLTAKQAELHATLAARWYVCASRSETFARAFQNSPPLHGSLNLLDKEHMLCLIQALVRAFTAETMICGRKR